MIRSNMLTVAAAIAPVLAVACPAIALAGPQKTPSSTYDYSGRVNDADFKGSMSFTEKTRGRYEVHAVEKTDGQTVDWSGEGTLVNNLIKIKRTPVKGIDEALSEERDWTQRSAGDDTRVGSGSTPAIHPSPINDCRECNRRSLIGAYGLRGSRIVNSL